MFHKVMQILEAHHFRLPACRFVLDLFDKRVLRKIVLDEEDEEDENKGEGDNGDDDDDGKQHEVDDDDGYSSSNQSEEEKTGTNGSS